ncbi:hypothetical protein [Marivirga sp.]|uniref:hypothetical protein n=1 Tax=Marivirga sp. TaxID=2018662 RepID=UPI0025F42EEA|nr:hypothetical protein [Marivirga sp.]
MNNKQDLSNKVSPRENFLMSLINKLMNEYKALLCYFHMKPFKIVDILNLSPIPGETVFTIQISHKNIILQLSAAEILQKNYDLNEFSNFHAEMIRKAAEGKLLEFLKLSEIEPLYKIVGKRYDKELQQYLFTIEDKKGTQFKKTADELANDKKLLTNIDIQDIYDIKFTQGAESILKEKALLLLAKQKNERNGMR